MKRTAMSLFCALALTFSVISCTTAVKEKEPGWTVDFKAAQETAMRENKDLLLDFTGSDWCLPCKVLKVNVFGKEVFKKEASAHFVLVTLDFPRDKSYQSAAEIAQNEELHERYGVTGFPTVILADATGRPYSQTNGYGGQSAEEYLQNLQALRKVRETRDAAFAAAQKATGIEQAKLLDKGLTGIDERLLPSVYKPEVDTIIAADADGAAGLKAKYTMLLMLPEVRRALEDIQQEEGDIAVRLKLVDDLVAKMNLTGEALLEARYTKAIIAFREDKAAARKFMESAVEAAPTTARAQEIKNLIEEAYGAEKADQ